MPPRNWKKRALKIRLVLLDVDGVLTDGRITYGGDGEEVKSFDVKDGQGVKFLKKGGIEVGILSSRSSRAVSRRARELGMRLVRQGIKDKGTELAAIAKGKKLSPEEIAFLGDDWADLPVFRRVGLAIAVADSIPELRRAAHFVTGAPGGRGAVREAAEAILKAQGKWAQITEKYFVP
ncbi:MAG: HAD hydrolase family protein [Deltaproteobacteria bacterium]|nr:HAD hydrolase family protein [Deltaproteobacteria bacterium]